MDIADLNTISNRTKTAADFFDGKTWYMGSHATSRTGFALITPNFGLTGDGKTIVVTVAKGAKCTPLDGLRKIKLSEYYQLEGK